MREEPATEGLTTEEPTAATAAADSSLGYVAFGDSLATDYGIAEGYMASDGVHPNDDGHAVIAQELRKLAYEPLYH